MRIVTRGCIITYYRKRYRISNYSVDPDIIRLVCLGSGDIAFIFDIKDLERVGLIFIENPTPLEREFIQSYESPGSFDTLSWYQLPYSAQRELTLLQRLRRSLSRIFRVR